MLASRVALVVAVSTLVSTTLPAQWRNRYPKLAGSNHHVYVEGY